jgi:hypothetical protein
MPFVIERASDVFEEISGAFQSGDGDKAVNHPAEWLAASTAEDRAIFRVHVVEPAALPAGMIVTATRYARVDGAVVQLAETAPAPIVVPGSVTPRQLRLALLGAGKLEQIEWFLEGPNAPREAIISWEYATEFLRSDPMLNQLAGALQPPLSGGEIDQLFVAAAQIQ